MNKFSKIVSFSILLSASLFANDSVILEFEKTRITQNPNVKVNDIKINTKKELPLAGWNGYILDVQANVQGKDINAKDILFSNARSTKGSARGTLQTGDDGTPGGLVVLSNEG